MALSLVCKTFDLIPRSVVQGADAKGPSAEQPRVVASMVALVRCQNEQ